MKKIDTFINKHIKWVFSLPALIFMLAMIAVPITMTLVFSLNEWNLLMGTGMKFNWGKNYMDVLSGSEFWQSLAITIYYTTLATVAEMLLGIAIALVLAVLLNRKMIGRAAYRTIFFLPMVAAPAAIAMVWRWLYNSEFGLLNHMLGTKTNWISNPSIAVFAVAVIGVWSILGYNMVLFLAGLQDIPKDYYEASSIDGANGIYQFFNITIPLLSPTIFFVAITRVIGGLQVFDLIFMVMDKNNPALYKTQSLVYLFYQESFVNNNKGMGSAIVVFLLIIIMIITVIQMQAQKHVYYN